MAMQRKKDRREDDLQSRTYVVSYDVPESASFAHAGWCAQLEDVFTSGDSLKDVRRMMKERIELEFEDYLEAGRSIPEPLEGVSVVIDPSRWEGTKYIRVERLTVDIPKSKSAQKVAK